MSFRINSDGVHASKDNMAPSRTSPSTVHQLHQLALLPLPNTSQIVVCMFKTLYLILDDAGIVDADRVIPPDKWTDKLSTERLEVDLECL